MNKWICSNEMNQLCKVCAEPAAGFHFGAFTCEGCKSFFGRTYNNLSSLSDCKNNNRCVINKKSRTSCKSCRLRKCIVVGMSKSGSRYGRRSNWFKIHCLLQDQGLHNGQLEGSISYGDLCQKMSVYPNKEESSKEEMMPRSPDSHSDFCGELDSKTMNGYEGIVKSGSLSPLTPYESPSPPYDKKENFLSMSGHPVSPLPPMSPVAALQHQQKLFGQAAAAAAAAAGFLHNGYNGLHRLSNGAGGVDSLAFRPFGSAMPANLDLLLRKRKPFLVEMPTVPRLPCASATEQEMPMDLSVKKTIDKLPEVCKSEEEDNEEAKEETIEDGPSCRKGHFEIPLDLTNKSYDDSDDSSEDCVQN